jgi:transposase InsO family protein
MALHPLYLVYDELHGEFIRFQDQIPWHIMTDSTVNLPFLCSWKFHTDSLKPGLIRWRIVIHAFIDGFSRFVTGIRASNNNRSRTVLDLFMDIIDEHGLPSRVRGDHGTENLLVAAFMEQVRGVTRGSYIWGRQVVLTSILTQLNL